MVSGVFHKAENFRSGAERFADNPLIDAARPICRQVSTLEHGAGADSNTVDFLFDFRVHISPLLLLFIKIEQAMCHLL